MFEWSLGQEFKSFLGAENWSSGSKKNCILCSLFWIFIIVIVIKITIITPSISISFVPY